MLTSAVMYLHIQRAQTSPLPIKNPTIHHHRQVLIPIYSALARTLTGPCSQRVSMAQTPAVFDMLDSAKFLTEVVSKGQNQMPISMPPFTTSRRQCEQGLTLLEVILSLGIISAATIGMNMIASRYADDTKLTIAASQMRTFGEAAKAYIKDNYATVQAVATPSAPAMVDVPTLIASQGNCI